MLISSVWSDIGCRNLLQTYQDTCLECLSHASALFHTLTRLNVWFKPLRPAFLSNWRNFWMFNKINYKFKTYKCCQLVSIPNLCKCFVTIWSKFAPVSLHNSWSWFRFYLGPTMLRSNGHLNLRRGHGLDSTCSQLAPNMVTKNAGNRHSKFPRGGFPGLQWQILVGVGRLFPHFWIFFYKKRSIKRVWNLSQKLEMAILETQIFKNFWGSIYMPPDPLKKLALSALILPPLPPPPSFWKSWVNPWSP